MRLIIIPKNKNSTNINNGLLRFAISSEPISNLIFDGLKECLNRGYSSQNIYAIPKEWNMEPREKTPRIIPYTKYVQIYPVTSKKTGHNSWFVISNGRYATHINSELLEKILSVIQADIVAINIEPELSAYREKVRLTAQNKIAGFRRLYSNSAEPTVPPKDWPHHIFVKTYALDHVLAEHILSASFSVFLKNCQSNALTLRAINVAGTVTDLETEEGLLNFCRLRFSEARRENFKIRNLKNISKNAKIIGKVLLGKNVHVGPKAIILGPTIIGDNAKIATGAIIKSSIIGPNVSVSQNQFVQNRVVYKAQCDIKNITLSKHNNSKQINNPNFDLNQQKCIKIAFRYWPRFSYARCLKRIADCFAAIIVLILFTPIMPFIALAIKLNSPGPVFFKDKRQTLYGKKFHCLKFRTMTAGADKIQDKLRIISQVDGPQFKIDDDPRVRTVGRFLRETYIDEIPQFFNVLLGQMSVVGPRPSPEVENTLCPPWRDARLSVRPGITGLWQVRRTRQPAKDFQEWINFDIKYVRDLSLKLDLWICWQTAKKMVRDFVSQF